MKTTAHVESSFRFVSFALGTATNSHQSCTTLLEIDTKAAMNVVVLASTAAVEQSHSLRPKLQVFRTELPIHIRRSVVSKSASNGLLARGCS